MEHALGGGLRWQKKATKSRFWRFLRRWHRWPARPPAPGRKGRQNLAAACQLVRPTFSNDLVEAAVWRRPVLRDAVVLASRAARPASAGRSSRFAREQITPEFLEAPPVSAGGKFHPVRGLVPISLLQCRLPVQHHRERRWRGWVRVRARRRSHQEPLAIRGGVPREYAGRHLEEGPGNSGLKDAAGADFDRHRRSIKSGFFRPLKPLLSPR